MDLYLLFVVFRTLDSKDRLCLPSAIQKPFLFFEADKLRDSYIYEVETGTIEEAKRPNLADLSPHSGLRKKFRAFLLEWNHGGLILWVFFFFFFEWQTFTRTAHEVNRTGLYNVGWFLMCSFFLVCLWNFAHLSSLLCLIALQYLNRGCTRFFATKDTDKHIMQNRKSPEVQYAEKSLSSTSLWNLDHRISRKTQFHWNVRLILRYYSNKATYWSFQLYILLLNSESCKAALTEFRIILIFMILGPVQLLKSSCIWKEVF